MYEFNLKPKYDKLEGLTYQPTFINLNWIFFASNTLKLCFSRNPKTISKVTSTSSEIYIRKSKLISNKTSLPLIGTRYIYFLSKNTIINYIFE